MFYKLSKNDRGTSYVESPYSNTHAVLPACDSQTCGNCCTLLRRSTTLANLRTDNDCCCCAVLNELCLTMDIEISVSDLYEYLYNITSNINIAADRNTSVSEPGGVCIKVCTVSASLARFLFKKK
jgi:hypothetical protein